MSIVIEQSEKEISPIAQQIVLENIGWATYESLLADLVNQSSIRLTYDQGRLEIMTPLFEHEEFKCLLSHFVEILAEEMGLDLRRSGSTTFKREDLAKGFEPDASYYIQNESKIANKRNIDLTVDPPPDLVIEIDITSHSLNKLPIYAELGVPEIWRYDGKKLSILQLSQKTYTTVKNSLAFPLITDDQLSEFLQQNSTMKSKSLSKAFRELIRKRLSSVS